MENKEIRAKARESLKGNWGIAIGAIILTFLIALATQITPIIGFVIYIVISGALTMGINRFMLSIVRKEDVNIFYIFDGFNRIGTNLSALLLQILFIILWSLLLIIPGIIAAYAYSMTFYILADNKEMSAMDAIKKSKEMMEGNKMKLFWLSCSFIGWFLLAILTLGIGLIWLAPYISVSIATFYDDLKNISKL